MIEPWLPPDEPERIRSLRALNILDTPAEERFDRITRIAAAALDMPIALISLVDSDRQWFKSRIGLDSTGTSRSISFCGHGILTPEPLIVPDAAIDPRFTDNPLVLGNPNVRFYAGYPLDDGAGHRLGMLCVLDREARTLKSDQIDLLKELSSWAEEELRTIGLDRALRLHRETLERLDTIIEALIDGFIAIDMSGTILAFNTAAESIFGFDRTDMVGQNVKILMPEPHRSRHDSGMTHLAERTDGSVIGFDREVIGVRATGEVFPIELTISRTVADSEPLYLALVRDITERRRGEDALRRSEELYRALSDLAPVGIFRTDEHGRYVYVNQQWCEITGMARQDVLGTGWVAGLHPEDAGRVLAEWSMAVRNGEPHQCEFRFQCLDGRVTWVSGRSIPQIDDTGRMTGYLGVINDITDRRAAEMALRASEEIHRSVIDSMSEGIVVQDHGAQIVGCNAAAERILGLPVDRLLDWASPDSAWHAVRQDGTPFAAEEHPSLVTLRTGKPCTNVVMGLPQAAGDIKWISVSSQPLVWEGTTTPWGVSCTFADITDRQLIDRMKSEFISVVSHELRTPLTSIRGALGLLAGGAFGRLDERPQRMVDIAVANTERLGRLVNDILDIERIESGTVGLSRRHTDAAQLVRQAIEVMAPMADKAGITLESQVLAVPLWVDPDRIIQTLTNLISNAIKFSPPNSMIKVTTGQHRGFVTFEVIDQGRGVPDDKIETIFGRFQQVDASDSRAKGGTGLGLAICRSIVEQHGGLIWARSRLGVGSTFAFNLPVTEDNVPESQQYGPTILVFDDSQNLSTVLRGSLEDRGCLVTTPASSEKAVRLARSQRPEAVLIDLGLPRFDGWAALSALRASPAIRDTPVIVVGCRRDAMAATVESALDAGRTSARALVFEDDQEVSATLTGTLNRHGIDVVSAQSLDGAVESMDRFGPDLLVFDLGLARRDWMPFVDSITERGRCVALALPGDGTAGFLTERSAGSEAIVHRIVEFVVIFTRRRTQGIMCAPAVS